MCSSDLLDRLTPKRYDIIRRFRSMRHYRAEHGPYRLVRTLRYGSADELLEVQEGATTRSLSYDARGNLIGILASGPTGTTVKTFEWDSESRLVRVAVDGAMRFEGDYLAGYELSEERTPSKELLHTWFAGNIVASRSAGTFEVVDRSLTMPGVLDSNLARGPPDDRRVLVTDQLSSTLGETNSVGGVIGERRYTLYGEVREGDPADGVGFHGARIQEEAGLYYLRNRWYEAELGRLLSRDPLSFAGGLNLYGFVSASPSDARDPLGLGERMTLGPDGTWFFDRDVNPRNSVGPSPLTFDPPVTYLDLQNAGRQIYAASAFVAGGYVVFVIGRAGLTWALMNPYTSRELVAGFGGVDSGGRGCGSCGGALGATDDALGGTTGPGPFLDDLVEDLGPHLFRGTTQGYPGNPGLQRIGVTPTSRDPGVATLFAAESSRFGRGVVHIVRARDVPTDRGNVLSALEAEVAVLLPPAELARRARTVSLDAARSALECLGLQIPRRIQNKRDLDRAIRELTKLSDEQIAEFLRLLDEK